MTRSAVTPPAKIGPLRSMAFAAVLVVALLGGAELLLRVIGFEHSSEGRSYHFWNPDYRWARQGHDLLRVDDELFWGLRPFAPGHNELGYRGGFWPPTKPVGGLRVIAFGDSCTWGSGVTSGDQLFTSILEQELGKALEPRPVEVFNAGVPGYSSFQGRVLLHRLLPYEPDAVILQFGVLNDYAPAVGHSDREYYERTHGRLARLRRGLEAFRVFQAMQRVTGLLGARSSEVAAADGAGSAGDESPDEDALYDYDGLNEAFNNHGELLFGPRVPIEEFSKNLAAMVDMARMAGAEPILVVPGMTPFNLEKHPEAGEYGDRVRQVAALENTALLDPRRVFDKIDAPQVMFRDPIHPSVEGHRVIAEQLLATFRNAPQLAGLPNGSARQVTPGRSP